MAMKPMSACFDFTVVPPRVAYRREEQLYRSNLQRP
jgi:hypothetical protein